MPKRSPTNGIDITKGTERRGRPISRETKLGRLMSDRHIKSYTVAGLTGISPRILSEYCAGRREMPQHHLLALCRVLETTPDLILEDEIIEDDYEDEETQLIDPSTSTGGIHKTKTVEDLRREQEMRLGPRVSRLRKEA